MEKFLCKVTLSHGKIILKRQYGETLEMDDVFEDYVGQVVEITVAPSGKTQ